MANALWPASLPQDFFVGLSRQRRINWIQFSVDSGQSLRRRLNSNGGVDVRPPLILTQAQMEDFEEFFVDTLVDGTLPFDWIDPLTGLTATYRFMEYPAFSKMPSGGGTVNVWQATMNLEQQP